MASAGELEVDQCDRPASRWSWWSSPASSRATEEISPSQACYCSSVSQSWAVTLPGYRTVDTAAELAQLGADLVGVGVVKVVQDRERFFPRGAGIS